MTERRGKGWEKRMDTTYIETDPQFETEGIHGRNIRMGKWDYGEMGMAEGIT